jgi:hypothetical protein
VTDDLARRFRELFLELDGGVTEQRHVVTLAAIDALFDRMLNPPMLDIESPTFEDVDAAERQVLALIREEATERVH